ncbi:PE family protein, partial [Mycobacterium ulcerans]
AERAVSGVARPVGPGEPGGRGPDLSGRAEAMAASAGWDNTMAEPAGRVAALGCSVAQAGPAAPADTAV